VVSGTKLPKKPMLKNDQWLRWELTGDDAILLDSGKKYAFLLIFDEPAPEREMALANLYSGPRDFPGHGIRREGSIAEPWRDKSWVNSRAASSLPLNRETRLAQQPGTWGRPDVDTTRVLTFYLEGTEIAPKKED